MAGRRYEFPFQLRILLLLLGTCWLLAGALMVFQYHREKDYKTELMDTRLQMHNQRILDDLRQGEEIAAIVSRISSPADSLRVTLIDSTGRVTFDSRNSGTAANHNSRPEVKEARRTGEGHAIARLSQSDDTNYFYSALLGDNGLVIRSAAPYTHSLVEFLKVDRTILGIMSVFTLLISLFGLVITRKIALSINRLNDFAEKAEKGEKIYSGYAFPHDELGNIASNIVKLYVQRDEQHRKAMRLEKDRSRLKKQLTNNINHELKTPVASILVNLDLLADHPDIPEEKKQTLLRRIRANAERLSSLLRDVSTITRMEDAPEMIARTPVNLSAVINEVADEARERTGMKITTDLPKLTVSGDKQLLESVFRNLIDNAIAYSDGTLITITGDEEGNIRFRDNGRGVAEEHLPHIFERFYRVDDGRARSAGGTGLGLSIVRNAVAVHSGTISAFNDHGLVFDIYLPVIT